MDNHKTEVKRRFNALAQRVKENAPYCENEEQTKISLVNPFIENLGYDVRDPKTVRLEFTADISGERGQKVDYAIMDGDRPVILIEAKSAGTKLPVKAPPQLSGYFMATDAKLALLTNGVVYQWYNSDNSESHKISEKPFLTHDVTAPTERDLKWLLSVKSNSLPALLDDAKAIELLQKIRQWFEETLKKPDQDFVRYLIKTLRLGRATPQFIDSVRAATHEALNDAMRERLFTTLDEAAEKGLAGSEREEIDGPGQSLETGGHEVSDPRTGIDSITLNNGKILRSDERPRAWRIGDGDWIKTKNAQDAFLAVVSALLSRDRRRHQPTELVKIAPNLLSLRKSPKHRDIPNIGNIYCYINLMNSNKIRRLQKLQGAIDVDLTADGPWDGTQTIEWWLPAKNKRQGSA